MGKSFKMPLSDMILGIDYQLADLCRHMTLMPGDIILTGTPANSRPMQLGDVIEIEVSGLGRLTNTVAERPTPAEAVGHQPTLSVAVRRGTLGSGFDAGDASRVSIEH